MRMSGMFFQTLREAPGDLALAGSQFLVRGGFVRSPAPGACAWLPLGAAVRQRVELALRCSLAGLGGQEIHLPTLQPVDMAPGAQAAWGGVAHCAAPLAGERFVRWVVSDSHDHCVLELVKQIVKSYRQLPALLYHIWQPIEPELRPARGLFGARETRVLDVWDVQRAEAERSEMQQRVLDEFGHLLELAGLPVQKVVSRAGHGDGNVAHQLVWPAAVGDVEFVACSVCDWAHDRATARTPKKRPPAEPADGLQEVATPGCRTIADLSALLGVPPARTAKALFMMAGTATTSDRFVLAVVRGDTDLSEAKLGRLLAADTLRPATEAEILEVGAEPGFGSPIGLRGVEVVVDDLVAASPNLVGGANRAGYHLLNTNCGRDYCPTHVADIVLAQAGDDCPACGSAIEMAQGVDLARANSLGQRCARAVGAAYLDAAGEPCPVVVGSYRFYVDRFIAAVCETHHDELGLVWPCTLAPYDVLLVTAGKRSPAVDAAADSLYAGLAGAGARVLYDDRDERAGVKFHDADLVGVPLRVVVGERGLTARVVEVKHRRTGEVVSVPIEGLVAYVGALL